MKNIRALFIILVLLFNVVALRAQAPQAISYQAVLRNASGIVQANSTADLRFSILQGSATGSAVYVETHSVSTDAFGSFSLAIGNGTPTTGVFASINWGNGPYFLQTEMDTASNGSYMVLSTSQFLSVPYALYAANSGPCIDTLSSLEIFNVRDSLVIDTVQSTGLVRLSNIIQFDFATSTWERLSSRNLKTRLYYNGQFLSMISSFNVIGYNVFNYGDINNYTSGSTILNEFIIEVEHCSYIYHHYTTVP